MKKLLVGCTALVFISSSCMFMGGKRVNGNGDIKSLDHAVTAFKNVQVSGNIDLYVSQGATKPVTLEADENLLQYIDVEQQGDQVTIKIRDGFRLRPSGNIKAYVTSTLYNNIDVSGASNIKSQAKIANAEKMSLQVSGAGNIDMDITAPAIAVQVSGAGDVNLKGETKTFDLNLSGAGNAHCFDLLSENTKIGISGFGNADVYASEKLDAQVSGAGDVLYKGGATNIVQQVSGAGSVKKAD